MVRAKSREGDSMANSLGRGLAAASLAVALVFGASACSDSEPDTVDQTEEQLEDSADQTEDQLEDKADAAEDKADEVESNLDG
jgi:hypothetical protein